MGEEGTILDAASIADVHDFPYRDREGNEPSYTYKVPEATHYLYIEACGGSGRHATGGESGGPGGAGVIAGLIPVVPQETLSIFVGDGAGEGWQGRAGYRPGGDGGRIDAVPSNGGGGGGSTAVVDARGRLLLHAGGGGGCGGRGGSPGFWQDGGDGGAAGLAPGNGTSGEAGNPSSPGGDGGQGGDPRRTDRGGNGGGGGGGLHCGDGGGVGSGAPSGGGGGGGGGVSDIIGSAIGVSEAHKGPVVGYVKISQRGSQRAAVMSSAFKDVFLRLDGAGLTQHHPIGGVVNCQYTGAGHFEHFYVRPQRDGTVVIESEQFLDVYLRIDGTGLSRERPTGAGLVNCRYGTDPLTFFRIVARPGRLLAIESVAFPGVFLGMDGHGVDRVLPEGGGKVYCRFDASGWEALRMPVT